MAASSRHRRCLPTLAPSLSYGPPWAHYLSGYQDGRTDYSVGPWDYPACATRHLMA
jgi:hypothetical protein